MTDFRHMSRRICRWALIRSGITDVSSVGGSVYVMGKNFTESSFVFIDGKKQDTVFLNENTLMVSDKEPRRRRRGLCRTAYRCQRAAEQYRGVYLRGLKENSLIK